MATISKYQIASGATLYRVRYRTPGRGQTDKRGFKTKRDAEAFANTVEVTHSRYAQGCRCDDCREGHRLAAREYSQRKSAGQTRPHLSKIGHLRQNVATGENSPLEPGPVEAGVQAEIHGVADARPGLAQIALALARILDNPRAMSSQPAPAKVLASLMDKLRTAGVQGRGGRLAVVRTLTAKGNA